MLTLNANLSFQSGCETSNFADFRSTILYTTRKDLPDSDFYSQIKALKLGVSHCFQLKSVYWLKIIGNLQIQRSRNFWKTSKSSSASARISPWTRDTADSSGTHRCIFLFWVRAPDSPWVCRNYNVFKKSKI